MDSRFVVRTMSKVNTTNKARTDDMDQENTKEFRVVVEETDVFSVIIEAKDEEHAESIFTNGFMEFNTGGMWEYACANYPTLIDHDSQLDIQVYEEPLYDTNRDFSDA